MFLASFLLLFALPLSIFAVDFETLTQAAYTVDDQGQTQVKQNITITNQTASNFPKRYHLTLNTPTVSGLQVLTPAGHPIPYRLTPGELTTDLELTFTQPVVGKGKATVFSVTYFDPSLSVKKGRTLTLNLPPPAVTPDRPTTENLTLSVPKIFGSPVSLTPPPTTLTQDPHFNLIYYSPPPASPIVIIFGDKRVYDLELTYSLHNPTITPIDLQLVLPPDTDRQQVYLDSIEPPPTAMTTDVDGNWIAAYHLPSQGDQTVRYHALIAVSFPSGPAPSGQAPLSTWLAPAKSWPVDHPLLQTLAAELNTPAKIAAYLSGHFDYSDPGPNTPAPPRLGTLKALSQTPPQTHSGYDYADTFVTLARAARWPSRVHVGYAFLESPQTSLRQQPNLIPHAWPDYYDAATGRWYQLDPAWESNSTPDAVTPLGFNHLTFSIHGQNSDLPQPPYAYFTQTPPQLSLSDRFPESRPKLQSRLNVPLTTKLGLTHHLTLSLSNQGNTALTLADLHLEASNRQLTSPPLLSPTQILPYQTVDYPVSFKPAWIQGNTALTLSSYVSTQTHYLNYYTKAGLPLAAFGGFLLLVYLALRLARYLGRLLVHR